MRTHRTTRSRFACPVALSRRRGRAPARLTAAVTTTALLAATAAVIAAGTATAAPGCAPVTAILVPGTGETSAAANDTQPVGLLATQIGRAHV